MDKQKYIVPATILPSQVYTKNSLGFLNLLSSLLHNFIDGFAIGVAYSTGNPH